MSEAVDNSAQTLIGRVVSNKMQKTIVVLVERKVPHPKYGKYVKRNGKRFAHDEENICREGDLVMIKETRPLSKKKNYELVKVIQKSLQESVEKA